MATGTLRVEGGAAFNAPSIFIQETGTLEAIGGTIGGTVDLNGGVLLSEVPSAADPDILNVTQDLNVNDGIVHAVFVSGFAPAGAGETFQILTTTGTVFDNAGGEISLAITGLADGGVFQGGLGLNANDISITSTGGTTFSADTTYLFGADRADTFDGGLGDDVLLGGGGDDNLFGGLGADLLDGGIGIDTLEGGADSDTFVLRAGDGADMALGIHDLITDFEDGLDFLGLTDGLTFGELTIGDGGTADTTISVTASNEVLALVQNVTEDLIDEFDFVIV